MRFLVAPSGFKESLDAVAVADAIAAGIHRVVPGAVVDKVPLVDGGEGSAAAALAAATGGTLVPVLVTGPTGDQVPSHFALLDTHGREIPRGGAALAHARTPRPVRSGPTAGQSGHHCRVQPAQRPDRPPRRRPRLRPPEGRHPTPGRPARRRTGQLGQPPRRRPHHPRRRRLRSLGAGLHALGATLVPRFDVILDHSDLDARLPHADLVITAEGAIDAQTPHGKVPAEVARRAKRHGKPVIALAGTIGADARVNHDIGIDAYTSIIAAPVALDTAIATAACLLTDGTERTLRLVLVGAALTR